MEKQLYLTSDGYIKLNQIAYNSSLSLSTTLNVMITNFLRFKKKYVYSLVMLDGARANYNESKNNDNLVRFHWFCSKKALDSLNKLLRLPIFVESDITLFNSLMVCLVIREYKGKVIKTVERLRTVDNKQLAAVKRYYKFREIKAKSGEL